MGQSGSSSAAVSEIPAPRRIVSRHVATFKKLYGELSSPEETGEPANDDLFRVRPHRKHPTAYDTDFFSKDAVPAAFWWALSGSGPPPLPAHVWSRDHLH